MPKVIRNMAISQSKKVKNLEPYHLADLCWFLHVGKKLSYHLFFSYGRGKIVKALCPLKLKSKILCSVRISEACWHLWLLYNQTQSFCSTKRVGPALETTVYLADHFNLVPTVQYSPT